MAGPPCSAPLEYFYGPPPASITDGGLLPNITVDHRSGSSDNFGSFSAAALQQNVSYCIDPVLDGLLSALQKEDQENYAAARLNGKLHSVNNNYDSGVSFGTPDAVLQTVCKSQPNMYERPPSRTITYNPPPSSKVVHLQCMPPADHPPPGRPSMPSDLHPLRAVNLAAPAINVPCMRSLHPHRPPATADLQHSHIIKPAYQPPPNNSICKPPGAAHANFNCSADPLQGIMGAYNPSTQLESTQGIHDAENSFSFHLPSKEFIPSWPGIIQGGEAPIVVASSQIHQLSAETTEMGDYQISHDQDPHPLSKLTAGPHRNMSSTNISDDEHKLMMKCGVSGVNICGSPISCPFPSGAGGTSPAYMRSSYSTGAVSDSAAMEISGMHATSSQTNSERKLRSVSVPQSPTPSVNKMNVTQCDHASAQQEMKEYMQRSCSSSHIDAVAFRVKTGIVELYDGFSWRKYGEKAIKKAKHRRSYYRCDRSTRCGCEVKKFTQRCPHDEEYVVFTYHGRHNHHP